MKTRFIIRRENLKFGLDPMCVAGEGGGRGDVQHSNQLQVKYKATGGW